MHPSRILATLAVPALALTVACADSPTAPSAAAAAPTLSKGAVGGPAPAPAPSPAPAPAPAPSPKTVAGQWGGAFQTVIAYNSNVSFSLAQTGSVVTGAMTFTLTSGGGTLQSPVTGSWDGTTLTLHFNAPNGAGTVVARPSAHGRYGVAFVSLVHAGSSAAGTVLGTLNVGRI